MPTNRASWTLRMEPKQEFPTFCYNVKNIQMIPTQLGDDNKTIQYIATQPFTTYGQSYALVNPVQITGTQNGQIVINKPISAVSKQLRQLFEHFNNFNFLSRTRFPILASSATSAVKYFLIWHFSTSTSGHIVKMIRTQIQ